MTRFLLKETTSQLQSLQSSLECAMETTAEQTRQERQVTQNTLLHFIKHTIAAKNVPNKELSGYFQSFYLEAECDACNRDCVR